MTIMIRPTDELYEVSQIDWQFELIGILTVMLISGLIIKTIIKKLTENYL